MNRKLTRFANILEGLAAVLLLFSSLRAEGGLAFWLAPALTGILLGAAGLALSWLCSPEGLTFRQKTFGRPAAPRSPSAPTPSSPSLRPGDRKVAFSA